VRCPNCKAVGREDGFEDLVAAENQRKCGDGEIHGIYSECGYCTHLFGCETDHVMKCAKGHSPLYFGVAYEPCADFDKAKIPYFERGKKTSGGVEHIPKEDNTSVV